MAWFFGIKHRWNKNKIILIEPIQRRWNNYGKVNTTHKSHGINVFSYSHLQAQMLTKHNNKEIRIVWYGRKWEIQSKLTGESFLMFCFCSWELRKNSSYSCFFFWILPQLVLTLFLCSAHKTTSLKSSFPLKTTHSFCFLWTSFLSPQALIFSSVPSLPLKAPLNDLWIFLFVNFFFFLKLSKGYRIPCYI